MLTTRAPAKINLTLHVLGRQENGYHSLESLVAFTGAGDRLQLSPNPTLSIQTYGPTATNVGSANDNLVMRAARNLAERIEGLALGAFYLEKRLPVAAGIGGGSSDAAAALRLIAQLNQLSLSDPRLVEAACATGADVPVCLETRARMMRGVGDVLGSKLELPLLSAVLINPGIPVDTKPIFQRLGLECGQKLNTLPHPALPIGLDFNAFLKQIELGRNDLEDAACQLAPIIVDVLAILRAARGVKVARMSGSGATCFAIFDAPKSAVHAARVIRAAHPSWWIKTAALR